MEDSRSKVWILQYVQTQIQVSWCCHYWKEVSTGRGSETNVCKLIRMPEKTSLLWNWQHYKWKKHHTGLCLLESLSYWVWYGLKNLPLLSGFLLLDILSDPVSFHYVFLDNSFSSLALNLGTTFSGFSDFHKISWLGVSPANSTESLHISGILVCARAHTHIVTEWMWHGVCLVCYRVCSVQQR